MMNNPMMNINMMNMNNPMMNMNMINNSMNNMNMMNMNMMNMNIPMINMNNPMINNNMVNMMNLYQNNLSNNGNFQNNMNNAQNINNSALGRLPRDKSTNFYNPFNQNINTNYLNIVFATPSGNKVIISAPVNINIYDLLCKYMERISLGPNLICNGIYFLYDGRKLKKEDYNRLVSEFFNNTNAPTVVVLDAGNLIGALNYNIIYKIF